MNYAVIVVTCNRVKLLEECVNAILGQTKSANQVIIVNNNSQDTTEDYLSTIKDARFIIKHSKSNLGGSGGFALAMSNVDLENNDYVLIIDDDAIIQSNFVSEIEKNIVPAIHAYSGTVIEDGKPAIFHRKRITTKNILGDAVPLEDYNKDNFLYDIGSFCGLFISTSIIKNIGLPKQEFFIWHDDSEYCLRFHHISKIMNINSSVLIHKRKPGQSSIDNWRNYYGTRNQLWILKKYKYSQYLKELLKINIRLKKEPAYKKAKRMYKDAIRDARRNRFGINNLYLPY